MCTAISFTTKNHYFGRNLDLEHSLQEQVTVTPRRYPFLFRNGKKLESHHAMIGIAVVAENYPLYYDATNEKGLSVAGLNFPENAVYQLVEEGKDNVAPFELIPWIVGQCETVGEARGLLENMNVARIPFSEAFPLTPLHWIISDREESITVEAVKEGLRVYDNPVGVLTNNPAFDIQLFQLNYFMALSPDNPTNHFCQSLKLHPYSRGMGAMGMPGDWSSTSRFVKAAFAKMNSLTGDSESEGLSQFFQIMGSVAMPRGCVQVEGGLYEMTEYTSCCNTDQGIYYYTSYENSQITAVDMHREDLDGTELAAYPLIRGQQIRWQN